MVSQGALSTLDRVNRLLDGLSNDHRTKVLSFCAKNKWKLSAQDVGTTDPKYDELKQFMLREAQISQMWTVYDKEQAMREESIISHIMSSDVIISGVAIPSLSSPPLSTVSTSPISAPTDISRADYMDEFTKRIAELSVSMQMVVQNLSIMNMQAPPRSQNPRSSSSTKSGTFNCI